MAEVQRHGFEREAQVKKSTLLISEPGPVPYTGIDDIPAGHSANPKNKNLPIQYKTALGRKISQTPGDIDGQIMLADARRCHKRGHLELHVELFEQIGDYKHSLGITRMIYSSEGFGKAMFQGLPADEVTRMAKLVKAVPKGLSEAEFDRHSGAISAELARLKAAHGVKTTMQPKISRTGSARRLQNGTTLAILKKSADHVDFIAPHELPSLGLPTSIHSPKRNEAKPKADAEATPHNAERPDNQIAATEN